MAPATRPRCQTKSIRCDAMNINDYLAQYLVTNDEKVLGNIQNFINIAIQKVNKRLRGAFLEVLSSSTTLPPDFVAVKWLTVNGELYMPSLTQKEATYHVTAADLFIFPELTTDDVLTVCYYAVNQTNLTVSGPSILIHGAAAEALLFEGNEDGAAAETLIFEHELDGAGGWDAQGGISLGGVQSGVSNVNTAGSGGGGGSGGPALSSAIPKIEFGSGSSGVAIDASRSDHVHPAAGPAMASTTPLVEAGAGAVGVSAAAARADHVHPASGGGGGGPALSDTVPAMDSIGAPGVAATASRGDHVHPSDTAKANANGSNATGTWGISVSGSSASCTGNAATATNATNATTAGACSGNSATATSAAACTGNSASATYSKQVPAETPAAGPYVLIAADAGKCKQVTGAVTLNNTVFLPGDAVSIYNNSAAAIAVTQGAGVTLRINGAVTGTSRSIPAYTLATLWMSTAAVGVLSGPGIT